MATGEALEGIVDQVGVGVLANITRDKDPSGVEILAVASDNVVLKIVQVRFAACYAAGTWSAEEILHSLGDEESTNEGESQAGPSFLPFPELASDHSLARQSTSEARARDKSEDDDKNDDRRDDQDDDGEQTDGNRLLDLRVRDAEIHEREWPLVRLDVVDTSTDAGDDARK